MWDTIVSSFLSSSSSTHLVSFFPSKHKIRMTFLLLLHLCFTISHLPISFSSSLPYLQHFELFIYPLVPFTETFLSVLLYILVLMFHFFTLTCLIHLITIIAVIIIIMIPLEIKLMKKVMLIKINWTRRRLYRYILVVFLLVAEWGHPESLTGKQINYNISIHT